MMSIRIFTFGLVCLLLPENGIAQVPWRLAAEKFKQNALLFEKFGDSVVYSISTRPQIDIGNLRGKGMLSLEFSIDKWLDEQWNFIVADSIIFGTEDNLLLPLNKPSNGFYRITFKAGDHNTDGHEYYFIVEPDWQKDLMHVCQKIKQDIATHEKANDISASIVYSHFDNLQTKVVSSNVLTADILAHLQAAMQAKQRFDCGEVPFFCRGLSQLRFKRFQGAEYAEFALHVPDDYDPSKKWPVYMHIDPKRWSVGKYGNADGRDCFHRGMIDVWWHSVPLGGEELYKHLQWKDLDFFIETLRSNVNVDDTRMYLYGHCQNGIAAMGIAVNCPDIWAECFFSTGNSYRNLAGNMFNVPLTFGNVHPSGHELTAYYSFAAKCFQYHQCLNLTLISQEEQWNTVGTICPQRVINPSPQIIKLAIETLQYPRAYWLTIKGREDENYAAQIEASVKGQTIFVDRKNVDAYILDLRLAPLDYTIPMTLIDNGKNINIGVTETYCYWSDKYKQANTIKSTRLHGPIYDVFTDPYVVLYSDGKDEKQTQQIAALAQKIAGTGPVLPEAKLSDQIAANYNLVLVGRLDKCTILKSLVEQLPVQYKGDKISFDGQYLDGDWGTIMIYPNPVNCEKYIVLVLTGSDLALNNMWNVWKDKIANGKVDVAIFKVKSDNQYDLIRFEKFNTVWNWHTHWNEPLASVLNEHPKWRWRQWVGHVIRKQMNADVMISEEVFQSSTAPNYLSITMRDLHLTFEDQWIVKIKLKGRELKTLLMQSIAGISVVENREGKNRHSEGAKNPIIDGISFTKEMAQDASIHVSQIKPDQYYTVAMPYKFVNGSLLGTILNDYEIIEDGYLLPLINKYLRARKSLELDSELERMKLLVL